MLPEPNFPAKPNQFIGRRLQITIFRQALQHGLATGRTSSFAILGDWGIGKSSLLLKFATLCSDPPFALVPVFISGSKDIHDYLRLTENLLDNFAEALLALPKMQTRLRTELQNWRFKRVNLGGFGLERESPRFFLSSGSSLLRHTLKEAWYHFLRPARFNSVFSYPELFQNLTAFNKEDLDWIKMQ